MEQWLFEEGCDGFNIMFPYVPEGLNDFVDKVVPELQRRGLFRREYEGKTLRENLGLPRPENQFFSSSKERSAVAPKLTRTGEAARSHGEDETKTARFLHAGPRSDDSERAL
jgi:hypothetical protein